MTPMADARAWIDQVDARTNAATDGPWEAVEEVRTFYPDDDACAWCESGVPRSPEDVKGGHAHLLEPHLIRSLPARTHVAGNFDYEEGGIVNGADTRWIAAARTDLPAATTALRAVLDLHRRIPYGSPALCASAPWVPPFVCEHCLAESDGCVPYPCPTVTAITTALEHS